VTLRDDLDRTSDRIASARVIAKAIVDARQKEEAMARLIEVKGLAGAVAQAKDAIRSARGATVDLSTTARALALEAADVTQQLQEARDDLKFEASTLGNSSGSEPLSEKVNGIDANHPDTEQQDKDH